MEVRKRTEIILKNNSLKNTEDEAIDIESKQYKDLLKIYEIAMNQVKDIITIVGKSINNIYNYPIIEKVTGRVKSSTSIQNKLLKKELPNTYVTLVDNINDIAGVRVVCPIEEDIYNIVEIIKKIPNIKIIQEKDYLNHPKKSGYKAYHLIVETPVYINQESVTMKVEIQIRTIAMDFWSEMEHDIRYKTNNKISKSDSRKLTCYAKNLEKLQNKIVKIYRKHENNAMYYN